MFQCGKGVKCIYLPWSTGPVSGTRVQSLYFRAVFSQNVQAWTCLNGMLRVRILYQSVLGLKRLICATHAVTRGPRKFDTAFHIKRVRFVEILTGRAEKRSGTAVSRKTCQPHFDCHGIFVSQRRCERWCVSFFSEH